MEKQKKNIAGTVRDLVAPVADEFGFMLWDVEYVKEGADMILRITIDKPEGIDIEDCEKMARAIDPIIDEADPIDKSYYLEVCSPGLERELTRDEHFTKMTGQKVKIKLYKARDGVKEFAGTLKFGDKEKVVLENGDNDSEFLRSEISFCKLDDINF